MKLESYLRSWFKGAALDITLAKKVFDEMKLNLSIYDEDRLKKASMTEAELTNDYVFKLIIHNEH